MMATVAARYTILSCRTVQGWIDFSPSDVTSEASMRVKQMPTAFYFHISTFFFFRNLPVDIPLSKSYNLDDQSQITFLFSQFERIDSLILVFKFKKWKN